MRITWEQAGDEFPTRWDSNCVRRGGEGTEWTATIEKGNRFFLTVFAGAYRAHWEPCYTLAIAKARGAEVLRALCGGPALKSVVVWCLVTKKGHVHEWTASPTRKSAWRIAPFADPKSGEYTVRKFRIEEVR